MLRLVAAGLLPFVDAGWRLPLVAFGAVSDWADGVLARRFHAQTKFGAWMDGVADKALVLSCVITFVRSGDLAWGEAFLLLARDITVVVILLLCVLTRSWQALDHVQVRWPGKITTALVLPWFITLLIPALAPLRPWLFWPATTASLIAAIDYAMQAWRYLRNRE